MTHLTKTYARLLEIVGDSTKVPIRKAHFCRNQRLIRDWMFAMGYCICPSGTHYVKSWLPKPDKKLVEFCQAGGILTRQALHDLGVDISLEDAKEQLKYYGIAYKRPPHIGRTVLAKLKAGETLSSQQIIELGSTNPIFLIQNLRKKGHQIIKDKQGYRL